MDAPRMSAKVKATRVAAYKAAKGGGSPVKTAAPAPAATKAEASTAPRPAPEIPAIKQMYVHVKNTDDHESLTTLRQLCSKYPGADKVVLVLGQDKKSAIKLPFSVEAEGALMGELVKLLGEDCVALK